MDKLFEQILKYLPAEIIPVALAAAAAFFGVYYYKAFRNYTDVLHDNLFLSIFVVIVAGFLLYRFNKPDEPPALAADLAPLLLVPEFVDDERGQFKTLFIQQVGSAIQTATKRDKSIMALNSFLLDQEAARITAQHYKALAVIFGPKIVRLGDKVYLCFNLLRVDVDLSKPYPPSAAELDKQVLDDITATIASATITVQTDRGSPSRVDVLEKRVADLELAVTKLSTPEKTATAEITYKHKRAIVVGVDEHDGGIFPNLRYSVSDARRMAAPLREYGFEVALLENATTASIEQTINQQKSSASPDDLFLFYFSGRGIRSDEVKLAGDPYLIIGTSDMDLQQPRSNLGLPALVEHLKAIPARHRLLILDACYGTTGIKAVADKTMQIFAGSQDNQYGTESALLGGGVFTSAVVGALQRTDDGGGVSMERLANEVSAQMALSEPTRQQPKLLTFPGADQIVLARKDLAPASKN
jgi:hypothetical protein